MKQGIEWQVSSLEPSQKLKELGVKQESYFDWYLVNDEDGNYPTVLSEHSKLERRVSLDYCSAYTVAELGEMLKKRDIYLIPVSIEGVWTGIDAKKGKPVQLGSVKKLTEVDARALMLIYLLENDLITL